MYTDEPNRVSEARAPITEKPQVAAALERLQANLDILSARVADLSTRLAVALRPAEDCMGAMVGKVSDPMSPLAEIIAGKTERVITTIGIVNDLIRRLEV